MKKAIVLLSGGLDSTVAAYYAKKDVGKTGKLYCFNVSYGQHTYEREKQSARMVSELLEAELMYLHLPLNHLVNSALTGQCEVPTEDTEDGIPSTWVPQRNSIFLALAFAYAETVDADWIYTGFNSRDYSGYPDCRQSYVDQIQKALNLASKVFVETGKGTGIVTPLMYKHKWEIITMGQNLGVDFGLTWSCYKSEEKACGLCSSCRIRLAGFNEAGLVDPLDYEAGINLVK